MAKAQLSKSIKLANINNADFDPNSLLKAAIFRINNSGQIESDNPYGVFLLNPDSYEESKSSNWIPQTIPGQSDPIYQWVSGGTRMVRFEALVTKEHSQYNFNEAKQREKPETPLQNLIAPISNTIAAAQGIGNKIQKSIDNLSGGFTFQETVEKLPAMSIHNELNYYRSLLYPEYDNISLKSSPPLIALYTGRAINTVAYSGQVDKTTDLWIVTNLTIKHTKFLPDHSPMEALVSFELAQYTINSFGKNKFSK